MKSWPAEPPDFCYPPDDGPFPPEDVKNIYYINYDEKMKDGTPCAVIGCEIDDYGVNIADNFGILVPGSKKLCEEYGVEDSEAENHLYLLTFRTEEPLIQISVSGVRDRYFEDMILIEDNLNSYNSHTISTDKVIEKMTSYDGHKDSANDVESWVYEEFTEQWEPEEPDYPDYPDYDDYGW